MRNCGHQDTLCDLDPVWVLQDGVPWVCVSKRREFQRHEWVSFIDHRDRLSSGREKERGWRLDRRQVCRFPTNCNRALLLSRTLNSPSSSCLREVSVTHTTGWGPPKVICTLLGNLDGIHCRFPCTLRINGKADFSGCQICVPVWGDCFFFFASVCTLNSKKKVVKLKEFPQK